jgi:hypothetical protein
VPPGATPARNRDVSYIVEVEQGLSVSPAGFATAVLEILTHPHGWQHVTGRAIRPAAGNSADLRVTLASPATVDRLCAPLRTLGEVSCWNGSRAVINALRWTRGASTYGRNLPAYRAYLISHEVGHALGRGHAKCPRRGRPAPVMLQQTLSLGGCRTNPWPAVTGG